MTESTQLAKAMHSMEDTITIQTEDGLITLSIKITMPKDCSDRVWDAYHNKFNAIVETAQDTL